MEPVGDWAVAMTINVNNRAALFAGRAPRTMAYDTSSASRLPEAPLPVRLSPHADGDFIARTANVGQTHRNGRSRCDAVRDAHVDLVQPRISRSIPKPQHL